MLERPKKEIKIIRPHTLQRVDPLKVNKSLSVINSQRINSENLEIVHALDHGILPKPDNTLKTNYYFCTGTMGTGSPIGCSPDETFVVTFLF